MPSENGTTSRRHLLAAVPLLALTAAACSTAPRRPPRRPNRTPVRPLGPPPRMRPSKF
jgi:hypothetical protein